MKDKTNLNSDSLFTSYFQVYRRTKQYKNRTVPSEKDVILLIKTLVLHKMYWQNFTPGFYFLQKSYIQTHTLSATI